ncbi:hypothetical protein RRG08_000932 [Elysia crispata]|uniref:Uncharacterized protein n=1 Tax=Elysia crispata TaxID=231223 RepID=A0AAE1AF14_9GAST|nr:hypothetical protein RRG08_000932 [Elysia crispata]
MCSHLVPPANIRKVIPGLPDGNIVGASAGGNEPPNVTYGVRYFGQVRASIAYFGIQAPWGAARNQNRASLTIIQFASE